MRVGGLLLLAWKAWDATLEQGFLYQIFQLP